MLTDALERFSDRILAVQDDGACLHYSDVLVLAERMRQWVSSRSVVFCLCKNDLGSLAGYLALMHCRCIPVMLSASMDSVALNRLIAAYRPALMMTPDDRAQLPAHVACWPLLGSQNLLALTGQLPYPVHDDLAVLMTTSGSTGSPMCVRQSVVNIESNARAIAEALSLHESDRPITSLAMNYTYGLSVIHSHVLVGASLAVTSLSVLQRAFWAFFQSVGATSISGVPYHYELMMKTGFWDQNLPSLRTLTQAGGRMPLELARSLALEAKSRGIRYFAMYGQTEATARMACLPHELAVERCGSIGVAIPGGRLTLDTAEVLSGDRESKVGESSVGELVYSGPNVMLGYASSHSDLALGDALSGVLRTGDLAFQDELGYFYIAGRKSRFIKMFGSRVSLDDVELSARQAGYEVACTGADDRLVVFSEGAAHTGPAIKTLVTRLLKVPPAQVRVAFLDRLPRTDAGKICYADLR